MIKVGIVDTDEVFISRLKIILAKEYPGEFEIIYFPTFKRAQTAVQKLSLRVLLLNQSDSDALKNIPKTCKVALITENRDVGEVGSVPAVCKYQSVDEWHEFLVEFCAGGVSSDEGGEDNSSDSKGCICLFSSTGGGVGASAAAAAFCLCCASRGVSVIYLNFETLCSTERFFTSSSRFSFDDVMYALRSKRYELAPVLQKAIAKDSSGVSFIKPCKVVPDAFSVTGEEIMHICDTLIDLGDFEVLVLDMNFESTENIVLPFINCSAAVFVTDGSISSNLKLEKILDALPLMCNLRPNNVLEKMYILYNRFEVGSCNCIQRKELGKLGGISKLKYSNEAELIRGISELFPIRKLLGEIVP